MFLNIWKFIFINNLGVLNFWAEMIPFEPDPGNSGVGKRCHDKVAFCSFSPL